MSTNIKQLYKRQVKIWKDQNEKYFGITPIDNYTNEIKTNQLLAESADKFWNNGTCKVKELLENERIKNVEYLVPGSYKLEIQYPELIQLSAEFKLPDDYVQTRSDLKKAHELGLEKLETKSSIIAFFPCPSTLTWNINGTHYVLRISAEPNYDLIAIEDDNPDVAHRQNDWSYNVKTKKFTVRNRMIKPFKQLSNENIFMLEEIYGHKLTEDNFEDALSHLPVTNINSAARFKYNYVNAIYDAIKFSNRFYNPLVSRPIPINVAKMINTKIQSENSITNDDSAASIVLSERFNKISDLEVSRTIIYSAKYNNSFNFSDTTNLFDAFKTSTNKAAGKCRLILDNIYVDNGLLWYEMEDGTLISQYKAAFNKNIDSRENLSSISDSSFNTNNDPKRIMMTAKLRAQAVSVVGETNEFTHELPARICFGDFEGFNYGDAIIISRSFARKLKSIKIQKRKLYNTKKYLYVINKYQLGDLIPPDDYKYITGVNTDANFRNIELLNIDNDYITVKAEIPFGVGDKITNFHGSKGIVTMILENDQMPYLLNDLGPNMKAGPVDVIASGLSVFRRKSLGQIFEGFTLATGHLDVNNAKDCIDKYYDEMLEYRDKSVVSFRGTQSIHPVGINKFIRLKHDAVTKQSFADLKSNSGKMLKFGEMELLNLASQDKSAIINELDIRSIDKHADAFHEIKQLQETRQDIFEPSNNLKYFNIMRTLGINFEIGDIDKNINLSKEGKNSMSNMQYINEDEKDIFKEN